MTLTVRMSGERIICVRNTTIKQTQIDKLNFQFTLGQISVPVFFLKPTVLLYISHPTLEFLTWMSKTLLLAFCFLLCLTEFLSQKF
jgi:hypothetical protein